ncbi:unnamed protein product [Closterium sp. NIES-54]
MLRIFLSIVAVLDPHLMQLDMKNALLHNKLDHALFMNQPSYYNNGTNHLCNQIDEALYFKGIDNGVVCRVLGYGNDFLAASNSLAMLKELYMRDPAMEFGGRPETLRLVGYADANGASDKQTHSSTNGYVLAFGCAVVFWTSQHIKCATLSSTGSEYIVATKADKEAHRLRFLLAEFQLFDAGMPTILNMDSHLAIADAEGLELRDSLKHMERRYVCLQHMVKRKKIVLHYIPSTK